MRTVQLSKEQQRLVARLTDLASKQLDALAHISKQRTSLPAFRPSKPDTHEPLKAPRQPNALGIFGRRGSGKTTILTGVIAALNGKGNKHCWHVLDRPLDLSYAPREFPHGLTLIHWLHERLSKRDDNCKPRCSRVDASFDKVAQSYFRGSDGFNQLVRNLALSPEHYASAAAKEIGARLSLRQDIQEWLDKEAEFLGVQGFVIALDDVDLPPANHHHSLIWSLLDELHQDRLFVILAGDLQRLQRRLTEEDTTVRRSSSNAEPDPQAAQDLIYKVLPQVNRIQLQPWPVPLRSSFPPPNDQGTAKQEDTIGSLLQAAPIPLVVRPHLAALLPAWSRGLENVLRELRFRKNVLDSKLEDDSTQELQRSFGLEWTDVLVFLLESRFEFDLANQLRESGPLQNLAPTFRWGIASAEHAILWEQLRERMRWNQSGSEMDWDSDIPELLPDPQDQGLKLNSSHARVAEALVDLALEGKTITPERLVSRIPWLKMHFESCAVTVLRDYSTMDRDLYDSPLQAAAALYWLQLSSDNNSAKVGFWPLLALQFGERKRLTKEMSDFQPTGLAILEAADARAEMQAFMELSQGHVGEVLPYRNCRPILRLADALALQPWSLLESVSGRVGFVGLARLAAMLTYCAYWAAAVGNFDEKLELEGAMDHFRNAPEDLSESQIAEFFRLLVEEGDESATSRSRLVPQGISLLVNAPWFRGLV